MRNRKLVLSIVLVSLAATRLHVDAQELDPEMMKKWQEFMTPNEHHKRLKALEGEWTFTTKMWMDPNAPPTESKGKSSAKFIMDGRYLMHHVEGEFSGMPMKGMAIVGYDNIKKKYINSWIDNFGTGFMTAEGTFNEDKKEWTYATSQSDPMSGGSVKGRTVERIVDKDHWEMDMYMNGPAGKEIKQLKIRYTRAK